MGFFDLNIPAGEVHRDLLGVPSTTPFSQYMRLTIYVDNTSQAQALNSRNPILNTYVLVAIRPLNQTVFDQACERMEVDIISIDFSEKLLFSLKQPMVKAAVERGVCFEVTYSGLITDVQMRRQLICNAKVALTMGFFDLNIPYPEPSPSGKAALERQRTKLVVKAMELGYVGIAYNRTIKGVMSDSHRCSIPLLTLSSLLKVAPSLSLSVKLHRDLLGVPSTTPFRQYTRLTVCVDNTSQAQALNSRNPILKTYDLVAVRPLNQIVFDQACERMEVDIISIDFSEKLHFRLKQPMVKAAAERGVCFEFTYSGLITDVQMRRQLICNAKLLVDWTRGRNIILSSAAPSVNELRGPYDVSNLSLLLGLSKERAKAAISKSCRTLLAKSLRKKQYYKEAIRVEVIPTGAPINSKEAWHEELLKWDPISSGEGDLLLDDMAKSFSSSCKASKITKVIDFTSAIDSIPSHGFQIKDVLPATNSVPNFLSVTEKVNQSTGLLENLTELPTMLDVCPELSYTPTTHQVAISDNLTLKSPTSGASETFKVTEEIKSQTYDTKLELKCVNDSDGNCALLETNAQEYQSDKCILSAALDGIVPDEKEKPDTSPTNAKLEDAQNIDDKLKIVARPMEIYFPAPVFVKHKNEVSSDVNLNAQIGKTHETLPKEDTETGEPTVLEMNKSVSENLTADEQFSKPEYEAVEISEMPQQTSHEMKMVDESSVATLVTTDVTMEGQKHAHVCIDSNQLVRFQSVSGRLRLKRMKIGGIHLSPFKRLLNPIAFKKKAKKIKSRTKI